MKREIVSDTGPLISLEKMREGFQFIRKLYDVIWVPPAVMEELTESFSNPTAYLQCNGIQDFVKIHPVTTTHFDLSGRLHDGEIQAISLALKLDLPLLIEETAGRVVAHSLGLSISGIARQVVVACRKNVIQPSEADQKLQELLKGNRINQKVYGFLKSKIEEIK